MTVRAARPEDYARLAEQVTAHYQGLWTFAPGEMLAGDWQARSQHGPLSNRLVAEENGELVASLVCWPPEGQPGTVRFQVYGEPRAYLALFADFLARLAPFRLSAVQSVTREDLSDTPFLSAAGFRNAYQSWGAALDLAAFDFARFQPLEERLYLRGFEVEDVTDTADDAVWHDLYALFLASLGDTPYNPTTTYLDSSYQKFRHGIVDGRVFAAFLKGEVVGYTALNARENRVESDHTAVRAGHRGLGLATLLKARSLSWARQAGYKTAGTGGTVLNLPMLRVNQKLGYAVSPMWVTWVRELS